MTEYNKLAKECLNKYPNREIAVFMNPVYVGSVDQFGVFDDQDQKGFIWQLKQNRIFNTNKKP